MDHGPRRTRRRGWIRVVGVLVAVGLTAAPARVAAGAAQESLQARVWLGQGEEAVLQQGERARLYYRTSEDAYVALFHMSTDGIVRLLHPRVPGQDHYTRARRDYRLHFPRSPYWHVDDDPGVGYFFAVASPRPLDFSAFHYSRQGGGWDLTAVGRRVYQDPYAAMDDYVAQLIPDWQRVPYALDFVEYHVGRRYPYPRFLCYDCHGFRPYQSWNPYHHACRSFRLVIFTDPYFYPASRYRGSRVVYTRPQAPNMARFVFKERGEGEPPGPVYRRGAGTDPPGVRGTERRRPPGGVGGAGVGAGGAAPDRPTSGIRRRGDPNGEISGRPGRDGDGPTRARRPDAAPAVPEADRGRERGGEAPPRPVLRRRPGDDDAGPGPSPSEGNPSTPMDVRRPDRDPPRPRPTGPRDRADDAPGGSESASPPVRGDDPRRRPPPEPDARSREPRRPPPSEAGNGSSAPPPSVRRRPPPDA